MLHLHVAVCLYGRAYRLALSKGTVPRPFFSARADGFALATGTAPTRARGLGFRRREAGGGRSFCVCAHRRAFSKCTTLQASGCA